MRITFSVRNAFFDRPAVVRAMNAAQRRALSKAGSFVRRRARSSMRRRNRPSAPGEPPSAHAASGPSLKTILFAYEPNAKTVIVGPVAFNQVTETDTGFRTTLPGLHERGETASILESRWVSIAGDREPTRWSIVDRRRRKRQREGFRLESRRRLVRYPKRPFMQPALESESKNFPNLFKDSIRK